MGSNISQNDIFAKNLKRLVSNSGRSQKEIAQALGVTYSTFNTWCRGKAIPSMAKVQAVAEYFGVGKSDLLDTQEDAMHYYLDDEARELAEFLHKNPGHRVLFDASRKVKPEDIKMVKELIDRLGDDYDP